MHPSIGLVDFMVIMNIFFRLLSIIFKPIPVAYRYLNKRIFFRAMKEHVIRNRKVIKADGGGPPSDLPEDTSKVLHLIGIEIDDISCYADFDMLACKYSIHKSFKSILHEQNFAQHDVFPSAPAHEAISFHEK